MKRKSIVLFMFLATMATGSIAQESNTTKGATSRGGAFSKGDVGIYVASGFGLAYDYYGTYVSLPALIAGFDIGIVNHAGPGNISVGGEIGFKRAYNKDDTYDATWTNIIIAGRGIYHLTIIDNNKFDPYGGVSAGIRFNDYHDPYFDDQHNPNNYQSVYPVFGLFAGAGYYFTPGFGGFVELGYDISLIRTGITFKF